MFWIQHQQIFANFRVLFSFFKKNLQWLQHKHFTRLHTEHVTQCSYTGPRLNCCLFTFLFQMFALHNQSKALGGLNSAHCGVFTVGTSSAVLETVCRLHSCDVCCSKALLLFLWSTFPED